MSEKLPPAVLYEALLKNDVEYFCGVPDSSLSSFGHYLGDHAGGSHDIAVNEGNAVALAIGYHIASSKIPLVYMQNSGLGHAINPLLSLADPLVMGIPMVLLIGWRGQPGTKDEPQHAKQGLVTTKLLDSLDIPHAMLSGDAMIATKQVARAATSTQQTNRPFALLVESGTFATYKKAAGTTVSTTNLTREAAIQLIVHSLAKRDVVVATTGKTSRELFEYRSENHEGHERDLLIVGSMGHASSIAYGVAKQKPERKIFVIDGDGALLMHMGALPLIGAGSPKNFHHFIINNGAHESVGGQPTVARNVDLVAIAKASGYKHAYTFSNRTGVEKVMKTIEKLEGPVFVEINVKSESRSDLMRPTISPSENKESFMKFLGRD